MERYRNEKFRYGYIREHVISVTEQEPTLIADTIYNNIALYRKLDVKCIQRAVDCFGDSILKRDNWDLQINEKSSNISGGEKQKIAIIRQVVQDGQVMIFDEPTSAMDESGKKQFLQLIDQIKNHKIIIIVSHDNATLNTCDEIHNIIRIYEFASCVFINRSVIIIMHIIHFSSEREIDRIIEGRT